MLIKQKSQAEPVKSTVPAWLDS